MIQRNNKRYLDTGRIIRKSLIKAQIAAGETQNLFNKPYANAELINRFESVQNVRDDYQNEIFHVYKIDDVGNKIFLSKEAGENLNLNPNLKSFRLSNTTQKIPNTRYRTPREIYKFLDNDGKKNILVRDNRDVIKTISKNSLYDVNFINCSLEFVISDQIQIRQTFISNREINDIKVKLDIPNNLLLPSQIADIVMYFLDNEDRTGYFNKIPQQINNISGNFLIHVVNSPNNNSMAQTLLNDGGEYYLYKNVNYSEMQTRTISKKINVPNGCNCVIETLKDILNSPENSLRKHGNKKIFKEELKKMEYEYLNNGNIPSFDILCEFFEKTKTNYCIYNYTNTADKRENKTFKPREKTFNFAIYNQHIYYIINDDGFENAQNCLIANDKYLILDERRFIRGFHKLLKEQKNKLPTYEIIKVVEKNKGFDAVIEIYKNDSTIYVKDDDKFTNSNLFKICQSLNIEYSEYITESTIISSILRSREIKETKSFFLHDCVSIDNVYSEDLDEVEDNYITVDFNKYYSNILLSIDKIPIVNNLTNKPEIYKSGEDIHDDYIYSIEIIDENYNLHFKNDDIYIGKVLNTPYYKNIFKKMLLDGKIKIIDKIKCEWVPNYYKSIIDELFKIVIDSENQNDMASTVKNICNKTIGNFQRGRPTEFKKIKYHMVEKNEAVNFHHGENDNKHPYKTKDAHYSLFFDVEETKNTHFNVLENHRPLRSYIMNLSWLNIAKFIQDNNIHEDDIVQINTDSITFLNKKIDPRTLKEHDFITMEEFGDIAGLKKLKDLKYKKEDEIYYNGKYDKLINEIKKAQIIDDANFRLHGLKIQEYKKYDSSLFIKPNKISFMNDIKKPDGGKLYVNLGYAGCGKSYKIEKLINKFTEDGQTYVLLAPLNKVLRMYANEINKNSFQKIIFNKLIPIEDNIIIDEFYLINSYQMRHIINWLYTHNKNIYLFGDIYQLPPITRIYTNNKGEEEEIETEEIDDKYKLNMEFLKSISTEFNYYLDTDANYRNNFNFDVYKEFIKNEYTEEEQRNLINYFINDRCNAETAKLICYRNSTKNRINYECLLTNKQEFNKNKISGSNIPLIAKKNYKLNENIIINSKDEYNLTVKDKKYIISYEDINNNIIEFDMDHKKIISVFDVGYCLNLYNIQGQTMTNYKFILDDIFFLNKKATAKYNTVGAFYVLLSRIKEELTDNKITIQQIQEIKNNKDNKSIIINDKKNDKKNDILRATNTGKINNEIKKNCRNNANINIKFI